MDDPNNDAVTVTVSEPLTSGSFATDHTSAGEYTIVVDASDGELTTKETFTLTVTDVNVKPEISDIADVTVKEGDTVTVKPKVMDLDESDDVVVKISEPVGDDGVWQTSFTDHGEYEVKVSAYDGKETVTKVITVTVEDVNMPPEIIEISLGN